MSHRLSRLGFALAIAVSLLTVQAGRASATAPGSAPTIVSPVDGSSVGANPTLHWTAVGNAVRYRVQIATALTFSAPVYSVECTGLYATPQSLLPFGTLYWRVAGEDGSGNVGPYAQASFTISASTAPVTLTPTNGQTLTFPTNPVIFSWQPVPGATSYTVQVANSSSFVGAVQYTTPNSSYTLVDTQSFTLSDGTTPQSWWWQVQANFPNGSVSSWSTGWSYQVVWPATPQLETPANESSVVDTVFSWDPVPGAVSYDIQVSANGDWQNGLTWYQYGVVSTRVAPSQTLNNGSYYWRVRARAVGNTTNYGQWSSAYVFTRGWSTVPVTVSPLWPGGTADPPVVSSLEFSWTPAASSGAGWVDHASRYQIEIGTNPNFTNGTYSTCATNQTTFTPSNECNPSIAIGTPYYWRVRGMDDPAGVIGQWSSSGPTTTQRFIYEPSLPDLSCGPANGATVSTPVLCWSAVSGVQTYQVTIKRNDGQVVIQDTTWALSYTPLAALAPGDGPFSWNVTTIDSQGNMGLIWGTWPTFSLTAPTTDTSLSLLTPANLSSSVRMPSLTWKPYTGASYYEVIYGVTSGSYYVTPLSGGTHLPFAGFTYEGAPLSAQKYYWAVQAYDSNGGLLATSGAGTFFVGTTSTNGDWIVPWNNYLTPECQAQTNPQTARCTPLLGQTQEMSWTADPNAGAYVITVAKDVNFTNVYATYETSQTTLTPAESWLDSQAGESYYWFVRPCVDWGQTACGPGPDTSDGYYNASAYKKASPAPTGLTTTTAANPPVAATTIADQVTFNWSDYMTTSQASPYPVPGDYSSRVTQEAQNYRIQVSTSSDFSNILDQAVVDQTQYTPSSMTYPEGPLYWRVQAIDDSGNYLTMSSTGTVTKASSPITLTSPTDTATVSGVPYFTWTPQNWAANYVIEIYKNGDLNFSSSNRILQQQTKVSAWSYSGNLPAGVYAWRVQRLDASGNQGPWSTGRTFTLHPTAPTLSTPADQSQQSGSNLYFTWNAVQGAVSYQFQSSTVSDFNSMTENLVTVMSAWAPTSQYNPGTYYWRVNLLDASNNVLSTSGSRSFTVGTVPGKPTAVTATAGNASALVSWTAPSDSGSSSITSYTVTSSPDGKSCLTSGALSCTVSSLTNGQAYTFTVTATNDAGTGPVSDASNSVTPTGATAGTTYHAITPTRVLDTRNGTGGLSGPFTNHAARTFTIGGLPSNATAVTGNLTVTGQTSGGYLYIGPVATNNPTSSTLNFPVGDDRANAVTVQLGAGSTLSVTFVASSNGPTAQAIFDVTGYFTTDLSGATYHAIAPTRALDTRTGTGGLSGPFTNHAARTFAISGLPGNTTAVTGNLTVTGQTSSGYLFIGPTATNNPTSSTLNFPVGDDRANAVAVQIGSSNTLSITFVAPSNGPTAQVIFDLTGYFTADTSGAFYVPIAPSRALDTRSGTGGLSGPFTNHAARTFTVSGVPSGATAVTGNLTVTGQTSGGFLFIGPAANNNPTSSTLNFPVGDDRANAVAVQLGAGGSLSVTFVAPSNGPTAQAIFDVTGYFVSAG